LVSEFNRISLTLVKVADFGAMRVHRQQGLSPLPRNVKILNFIVYLSLDCVYRAGGLARAAVYAFFCTDNIDAVAFRNRVGWAVAHARAAGYALVVDFVSHDGPPFMYFYNYIIRKKVCQL
jgi:hypothetical protein